MDIRTLQSAVVEALLDVKGQDIVAFNTTGLTGLFDRVVIATGTSNRHAKALADSVRDHVKKKGGSIISVEGGETGEWVLVDLGDVVVHIMQPAIRAYYNLEEIWGLKPVALKLAPAPRRASTDATAPPQQAAGAGRRPGTKRAGATAKTSSTAAAKDAAPKKATPKKATPKTAAPRKPATKKTAPRKTGASAAKAAPRKAAARRNDSA